MPEDGDEVSETVVIRCSMKRHRVAAAVIGSGLFSVSALVLGLAGDAIGRGQGVPWLISVLGFAFASVGYLRCTKIVVDADHVYVHTFGQRTTTMRRKEIRAITRSLSVFGWYLYFVDQETEAICVVRNAYSSAQLDRLRTLLEVRLASDA